MNRLRYSLAWLALGACFASTPAFAALNPVQYSAPAVCPDAAAFVAAVKARGGDVTALDGESGVGDAAAVLFVRIEAQTSGFEGRLSLNNTAEKEGGRTARGATCEEVVDAMAVVAVLTLERQGSGTAANGSPVQQAAETASQTAAVAPAASQTLPEKEPPPTSFVGSTAMGFNVHEAMPVEAGTVHVDGTKALTLQGGAVFGVLPGVVLPRLSLTLVTTRFLTLPNGTQNLIGVIPMLRFSLLGRGSWHKGEDRVELEGVLGGGGVALSLGVCNSPHYNTAGWAFLICAEIGGKALGLHASRAGVDKQKHNSALLDGALSFSGEYNFNSYLHATFTAEGGTQLGDFAVRSASGARLVRLGTVYGALNLGLGVHF